ncbi:MAG: cytochrome c, partial [Bacteroidota bacterium]
GFFTNYITMNRSLITSFVSLLLILVIDFSCRQKTTLSDKALDQGQEVYLAHCVSCHGVGGDGQAGAYPALANRQMDSLYTQRALRLIRQGSGGNVGMKPIALSTEELRDVINYIQNSWGNQADELSLVEIEAKIQAFTKNTLSYE